jgi:hypothetical protein
MDPRAGLDGFLNTRLHHDSIPRPSSPQRVAIPTELSRPTMLYPDNVVMTEQIFIVSYIIKNFYKSKYYVG